ncbi:glycine zipper 2TM domain-containing protein [Rhodobacteraceae bacterium CCMM004]|nr:glycine zipper 2TM domain-containing protein [Rhodobacteraceae bacterium CCMM004]
MKTIPAALIAAAALAACQPATNQQRAAIGGLTGATLGVLTADALDGDTDWKIIGALAGATAGALVAQNTATRQCAYARGDGTYYTAAC